jgi:hypothetical protein
MKRSHVLLHLTAATSLLLVFNANARDLGQWEGRPAHIRGWFERLMQPDNQFKSCCGEADAYQADNFDVEGDHYVAIITDGSGDIAHGKPAIPDGTRIPVPNHKMKWDKGNPTGHGIIFISVATKEVYCYVTPGGV